MTSTTYYIGFLGAAGRRCNGAAQNVEPMREGEFTSLAEARKWAAISAVEFANQPATDNVPVTLAVVRENPDGYDQVLCAATGKPGNKRATWECAPIWS